MSREADFLVSRGWIREGSSQRGFLKAVIWHKTGICDGCQQWEALQIERENAKAVLTAVADVVLAYRPKSKQPKPRKRKKTKRADQN